MGKKQHYVPRFYLRFFSNNGENTHVGLYNFRNNIYISGADITNQAYENFFYGNDNDIEKGLMDLETDVARILNRINAGNNIPKPNTPQYAYIFLFTLLQAQRTMRAVEKSNEGFDKLLETLLPEEDKGKYTLRFENPAILNLITMVDSLHVAMDLACKLIINNSSIPFITSDDPVVKYNQFLERKGKRNGLTGLASKGLQMFYPISPNRMLLFYDSKVYKIGDKKKNWVETKNKEDIFSLNLLQTLDCWEQIFFNQTITQWNIEQIIEQRNRFYKGKEDKLIEIPCKKQKDGSYSEISIIRKQNNLVNLSLTFIKETDYAKQYKLTDYDVEIRDERLRNPGKFRIPTIHDFINT